MRFSKIAFITVALFCSAAVFSFEFDSQYTHIYSDEKGEAKFSRLAAASELTDDSGEPLFSFSADFNDVKSTYKEINGEIKNINFSSFIKNDYFGLEGYFGLIEISEIKMQLEHEVNNEGASGFYTGFALPFSVYQLNIRPYFYYGNLRFSDGDLAYFMGHPEIPYFICTGSNFSYKQNHLKFFFLPFTLEVKSNGEEELFNAASNTTGFLYYRHFTTYAGDLRFVFEPFAGYVFSNGDMNGVLSYKTQPYFYFVFDYLRIRAGYSAHILLTGSNANLCFDNLKINFDSALAFVLNQNASAKVNWKKRDGLAPWQEMLIWNSLDMEDEGSKNFEWNEVDKSGLVIFNLGAEYAFFNNMGKVYCNKKILLPFSLRKTEAASTEAENGSEPSDKKKPDSELVKNILLSGLSVGVKICF